MQSAYTATEIEDEPTEIEDEPDKVQRDKPAG
jgi:hypothetical protein